jgi:hypothetical protein
MFDARLHNLRRPSCLASGFAAEFLTEHRFVRVSFLIAKTQPYKMKQFMQQDARKFGVIPQKLCFERHLACSQKARSMNGLTVSGHGKEFATRSGQMRQKSQLDRITLKNWKPRQRRAKAFTLGQRLERWRLSERL